jgi:hypothetical protein
VDLSAVAGILPNQNRRLCSAGRLQRDGGISETVNDISAEMGRDVRSQLFLGGFDEIAKVLGMNYLEVAITQAVPPSLSEAYVIEEAVKHVQARLPEDKDCDETTETIQQASIRLTWYLWDCHGKDAAGSRATDAPNHDKTPCRSMEP